MKVLFLQNTIAAYNVHLYTSLQDSGIDITLAHTDTRLKGKTYSFKSVLLQKWKIFRFVFTPGLGKLLRNHNFDIVVIMGDISWLSYMSILFQEKRLKKIIWGIGVSAGYKTAYDSKTRFDYLRKFFFSKADALIFYSSYPVKKYINMGFDNTRLFVANNTVHVDLSRLSPRDERASRRDILFIGTLYKQKGIGLLVDLFISEMQHMEGVKLRIIGDGPLFPELSALARKYPGRIILHGRVDDDAAVDEIAQHCCVSISPTQAGLSVLKSFAFGVPFVTIKNAITGGEIFNIIDGYNGLLLDSEDSLKEFLHAFIARIPLLEILGNNAKQYYTEKASMSHMTDSFIKAFFYVLHNRNK